MSEQQFQTDHWALAVESVKAGMAGDAEKCRAFVLAWTERLEMIGAVRQAVRLRAVLDSSGKQDDSSEEEPVREINREELIELVWKQNDVVLACRQLIADEYGEDHPLISRIDAIRLIEQAGER